MAHAPNTTSKLRNVLVDNTVCLRSSPSSRPEVAVKRRVQESVSAATVLSQVFHVELSKEVLETWIRAD